MTDKATSITFTSQTSESANRRAGIQRGELGDQMAGIALHAGGAGETELGRDVKADDIEGVETLDDADGEEEAARVADGETIVGGIEPGEEPEETEARDEGVTGDEETRGDGGHDNGF